MSWQIKVENISKMYQLGEVGTGTLSHDLNRWIHKIRGKEDPYSKIAQVNDRSSKADSNYVWAIKDINFDVKEGEVLGIIGRNGAGKSTLLKILSKITSPTSGIIKTRGRIASLLEVGTGMHPEMTARENIFLNGAILGMTKKEIKVKFDEIIEFSGCAKYVDTPLKRFSSGMRVRLGFAVAAFLEPEILVVDEVLAVGDVEFQQKAIGKMQDISRSGKRTVLFVSHNMAAIKSLCTRAILMENGEIYDTGGPEEIVKKYLELNSGKAKMEVNHEKDDLNSKRKWDIVYLKSAKVLADYLTVDQEFWVEFVFDVNDSTQYEMTVSIDVLTNDDQVVFGTGVKIRPTAKKEVKCSVKFPEKFLNDESYYLNFYVLDKKMKAIFGLKRLLSFKIYEGKRDDLFFAKTNGMIRANLEWQVHK